MFELRPEILLRGVLKCGCVTVCFQIGKPHKLDGFPFPLLLSAKVASIDFRERSGSFLALRETGRFKRQPKEALARAAPALSEALRRGDLGRARAWGAGSLPLPRRLADQHRLSPKRVQDCQVHTKRSGDEIKKVSR